MWYIIIGIVLLGILIFLDIKKPWRVSLEPQANLSPANKNKHAVWIGISLGVIAILIIVIRIFFWDQSKDPENVHVTDYSPSPVPAISAARTVILSEFEEPIRNNAWNNFYVKVKRRYTRGVNDAMKIMVKKEDRDLIITFTKVGFPNIGYKVRFTKEGKPEIFDDRRDDDLLATWEMEVSKDVQIFLKQKEMST